MDPLDGGCGVFVALAFLPEFADLGGFIDPFGFCSCYAQRALDGDLPVAEGGVGEDLGLFGFLERRERLGDVVDVVLGQFAVLLAEVPVQGREPLGGVN